MKSNPVIPEIATRLAYTAAWRLLHRLAQRGRHAADYRDLATWLRGLAAPRHTIAADQTDLPAAYAEAEAQRDENQLEGGLS